MKNFQRNVSFSSSNDGVGSSVSVKERPLIYLTELAQLNNNQDMGNAIVSIFGYAPIKSKFTPSFKSKFFVLEKTNQLLSAGKYFNEEKVFYDMLKRNECFNKRNRKVANKQEVEDFIKILKIKIEKTDFESLNCFDLKMQMLTALENRNFKELSQQMESLFFIAKQNGNENLQEIVELKITIEQLIRLVRT